jgi:hypothetical protein
MLSLARGQSREKDRVNFEIRARVITFWLLSRTTSRALPKQASTARVFPRWRLRPTSREEAKYRRFSHRFEGTETPQKRTDHQQSEFFFAQPQCFSARNPFGPRVPNHGKSTAAKNVSRETFAVFGDQKLPRAQSSHPRSPRLRKLLRPPSFIDGKNPAKAGRRTEILS